MAIDASKHRLKKDALGRPSKKKIADFETSSQRWGGGVQPKPNLKKNLIET